MTAHREQLAAWLMRSGGQDWTTCAERLEQAIEAGRAGERSNPSRPGDTLAGYTSFWRAFWQAMDVPDA